MSNATYPADPVLTTTVEHVNTQENRARNNKIKVLQSMAGIQIVTGIICSAMGGTAMVLECYLSRIGDPIWSGLLFFMVAGIAGSAGTATGKQCGITFYAVWSSLSAACAAQLFGISVYAASQELELLCYPGIDTYKLCTYVIVTLVSGLSAERVKELRELLDQVSFSMLTKVSDYVLLTLLEKPLADHPETTLQENGSPYNVLLLKEVSWARFEPTKQGVCLDETPNEKPKTDVLEGEKCQTKQSFEAGCHSDKPSPCRKPASVSADRDDDGKRREIDTTMTESSTVNGSDTAYIISKLHDPVEISTKIESVGLQILATCPSVKKLTLSSIIRRRTGSPLDDRVLEVNSLLRSLKEKHKWGLIENMNVRPDGHLDIDGIHLNPAGVKVLARNIADHLREKSNTALIDAEQKNKPRHQFGD
eukprot:XP_011676621.1 PREDICTED: uncharacterized protein LOC580602 [Strongylocentrotus purpuratus]